MTRIPFLSAVPLVLSVFSTSLFAQPESIQLSYGPDLSNQIDVKATRLALRWHLSDEGYLKDSQWSDRFLLDTSMSYWDNQLEASPSHSVEGGDDIYGFFLTPVWQFQSPSGRYYFDAGLGIGWISDTRIRYKGSEPLEKSTNFQFETMLGAGARFGSDKSFDLGAKLIHYSNGYIKRPNMDLNVIQVSLAYHF
ncbi:acyloxyacyl hydrolase [Endozoicomonas arenosclerae]|uniref:acyloxyacyl hydrolase n=1 Tax=Endozoicomonas arenosclerae TaxID=1633495 RepID=UPI0007852BD0|nr:acyloxyacyl hydrolase [Endozoicomonas arenosclerae]